MLKCSVQFQELVKQDMQNDMKCVSVNVDLTVVFVIINNVGMMINAGVNAKKRLIKAYAIKDLFGVLTIVSANVINPVILVSIQTISCKCKKRLVDKLVERSSSKECTKNIEETRLVENQNKHKCSSCMLYINLLSIFFTINVGIGSCFLCFHWYSKKDLICVNFGTCTQTTI